MSELSSIAKEYLELRASGAPWMMVVTPDPDATIEELASVTVPGIGTQITVSWNLAAGHTIMEGNPRGFPQDGSATANKPFVLLQSAAGLEEGSVVFMLVPSSEFWRSDASVSAIQNLRAIFKVSYRTLVLVAMPGAGDVLPPQLDSDVPKLRMPLPDEAELRTKVEKLVADNEIDATKEDVSVAVNNIRGMTAFAAENAVARKILTGKLLASELAEVRREGIESATGGALIFERERMTFNDVGGLGAFKGYMGKLFAGPDAPDLVVRLDEIDKVVSAASAGAVADNTGISQDFLRTLLTAIEDNGWIFMLLTGVPGCGKTLSTVATGNTYNKTTLAADLGRCKGSLVGQSEAAIRQLIDIVKALGGRKVLLAATANRMDTLPPELLSRAGAGGIWYFDTPDDDERNTIWPLQRKRYGIDPADGQPNDGMWVGRDIRNCCRTARMLGCSLKEAATYTMITGVVSQDLVAQSRILAATSGYLSVSKPGRYQVPGSIDMNDLKLVAAGDRRVVPFQVGGSSDES